MHSKVDNGSFGQGLTVLRHATDLNLLLGICGLKRTSTAQDFLGRSSRVPCIVLICLVRHFQLTLCFSPVRFAYAFMIIPPMCMVCVASVQNRHAVAF